MGSRWRVRVLVLLVAVAHTACGRREFLCGSDGDCAGAGAGATCQADGWCSVADVGCASGQRYTDYSGGGLAGTCVAGGSSSSGELGTSSATSEGSATASTTLSSSTTTDGESSSSGTTDASVSTTITSTTDTQPVCGNGVIEGDEACDAASNCNPNCTLFACGDGYFQPELEECEPGTPSVNSCAAFGLEGAEAMCGDGCVQDVSSCGPCTDGCGAMSACASTEQCAPPEECVFRDDGHVRGTCLLPCDDPSCEGAICLPNHERCAPPCDTSKQCLGGRSCQAVDGEMVCVW
ncbi:MAG: hypothetical protein K1X88_12280 [Nannocystaceae bacterium]|nr:hypothetical protein [Nannocystaceae bacterium]